jgi:predicted GIY-YIG superfamily endonuclease
MDLLQNGYAEKSIDKIFTNCKRETTVRPPEQDTFSLLTIPYVKGTSEKIRRIAKQYKIKTVFKSGSTLRSVLTKTKPKSSNQEKECIYQVPCECGESYIGETKRPFNVRLQEHKKHTYRGETSRSGIADHVWSKHHNIKWSEAQVVHKEPHWKKRKFKEAVFIENNKNIFSKPSVEIPTIWKPLIKRTNAGILNERPHASLHSIPSRVSAFV